MVIKVLKNPIFISRQFVKLNKIISLKLHHIEHIT